MKAKMQRSAIVAFKQRGLFSYLPVRDPPIYRNYTCCIGFDGHPHTVPKWLKIFTMRLLTVSTSCLWMEQRRFIYTTAD